ncbi:MAG: hypothetical protein P8J78_11275 [Maricaulis sp.]|nr:hypothetical protein [Maricaulis sp.]MDG2045182.1 hypothetical protein [Maricaulis sp.]
MTLPNTLAKPGQISIIALALTMMSATNAAAQDSSAAQKPAHALAWMLGEWEGSGWQMDRTGTRNSFDVYERADAIVGGHAVTFTGRGYAPRGGGDTGALVHDAFGLITHTPTGYQMRAVTFAGHQQDVDMTITEHGFEWALQLGPDTRIVYTARLDGEEWLEAGAYWPANGPCRQTFEMRLTRVGD